ncbi:MAG: hypothetical protein ACM3PX_09105 [Omnitrophica WOR_2 bacterium]|jgi:hypothetical protein
MKIIAFRTPKPKPFSYKPRYYDPKKEELENLKKKYSGEKTDGGISPDFRARLRQAMHVKEKRTGNISKVTLIVYFALAILILYYIFF